VVDSGKWADNATRFPRCNTPTRLTGVTYTGSSLAHACRCCVVPLRNTGAAYHRSMPSDSRAETLALRMGAIAAL
jgi:hypothetical protein